MKTTFFAITLIYLTFISGVSAEKRLSKKEIKMPNATGQKVKIKHVFNINKNNLLVGRFYFPLEYSKKTNGSVTVLEKYIFGFSFFGGLKDANLIGIHTALLGELTRNCTVTGCSIAFRSSNLKSMTGIGINVLPCKNKVSTGLLFATLNKGKSIKGISFNLLGARNDDVTGISCSSMLSEIKKLRGLTVNGLGSDVEDCEGASFSLINAHINSKGVMVAGLNKAKDMSGLQLGLGNDADFLQGFQCGLLNSIKKKEHSWNVQFGIINTTKGRNIQIGLLNFCKDGFLPFFPLINF